MRQSFLLAAAFIAGGFTAGLAATTAGAVPAPKFTTAAPSVAEEAGYGRRYWRRRGYGPGVVPEIVVEGAPVIVEGPPVTVVPMLPPPRPLSCGEYHFWNGERCVDARYNPVDVGPK